VKDPFIAIKFSIDHGQLIFHVKNKKGKIKDDIKDDSSGIGLKNVLRRLELLYPQQHKITIRDTDEEFEVDLQITLQQN
jgi:LytS/YehU family sensor histidine kinase